MTAPTDHGGVGFVDLVAEYDAHRDEIDAAMRTVLDTGAYILGDTTARFEAAFASYCDTRFAVGVDSGFSALELALLALGVGRGDEVITSANTFYSTVRAIEACGATPVLVDADPVQRNIDPDLIDRAVTPATRAIVPVHLYGHPVDMAAVDEVARAHGLVVVEDACQAHGSRQLGRPAGGLGDAAAFSFYPAKNLGAFGDAGIVVTDRPDVDERVRRLRNLGAAVRNHHEIRGFNRRIDALQAAVLGVKLQYLDDGNAARRAAAERYDELLGDLDVTVPHRAPWAEPVYHLYVIEVDDRDELATHLAGQGIETGVHYPVPIHLQPAFASLGHGRGDFPVAERLASRILSLPMHPGVGDDVDVVADAVARWVGRSGGRASTGPAA